jgi:hypothetical protein
MQQHEDIPLRDLIEGEGKILLLLSTKFTRCRTTVNDHVTIGDVRKEERISR